YCVTAMLLLIILSHYSFSIYLFISLISVTPFAYVLCSLFLTIIDLSPLIATNLIFYWILLKILSHRFVFIITSFSKNFRHKIITFVFQIFDFVTYKPFNGISRILCRNG